MKKILILIALILLIAIIFWFLKGQNSAESMSGSQHAAQHAPEAAKHQHESIADQIVSKEFDNAIKVEMPVKMAPATKISVFTNDVVNIQDAYVREMIPGSKNTAAYFEVSTSKAFEINHLSSPQFDRVEIHETIDSDGVMSMNKLDYLSVSPPGISLTPGGKHIMLMGPKVELKVGDIVEIELGSGGRAGGKMTFNLPIVAQ